MAPFHAMAELKQTAQAKILMSQISIRKRAPESSNRPTTKKLISLMVKATNHLGNAINIDNILPPLTLLKITNGSL